MINLISLLRGTAFFARLPYAGLSAEVPHLEFKVFVRHLLHVEADRRYCGHDLAHLQPVQYRRLAGAVQPEYQYPHLPAPQQPPEVAEQSAWRLGK